MWACWLYFLLLIASSSIERTLPFDPSELEDPTSDYIAEQLGDDPLHPVFNAKYRRNVATWRNGGDSAVVEGLVPEGGGDPVPPEGECHEPEPSTPEPAEALILNITTARAPLPTVKIRTSLGTEEPLSKSNVSFTGNKTSTISSKSGKGKTATEVTTTVASDAPDIEEEESVNVLAENASTKSLTLRTTTEEEAVTKSAISSIFPGTSSHVSLITAKSLKKTTERVSSSASNSTVTPHPVGSSSPTNSTKVTKKSDTAAAGTRKKNDETTRKSPEQVDSENETSSSTSSSSAIARSSEPTSNELIDESTTVSSSITSKPTNRKLGSSANSATKSTVTKTTGNKETITVQRKATTVPPTKTSSTSARSTASPRSTLSLDLDDYLTTTESISTSDLENIDIVNEGSSVVQTTAAIKRRTVASTDSSSKPTTTSDEEGDRSDSTVSQSDITLTTSSIKSGKSATTPKLPVSEKITAITPDFPKSSVAKKSSYSTAQLQGLNSTTTDISTAVTKPSTKPASTKPEDSSTTAATSSTNETSLSTATATVIITTTAAPSPEDGETTNEGVSGESTENNEGSSSSETSSSKSTFPNEESTVSVEARSVKVTSAATTLTSDSSLVTGSSKASVNKSTTSFRSSQSTIANNLTTLHSNVSLNSDNNITTSTSSKPHATTTHAEATNITNITSFIAATFPAFTKAFENSELHNQSFSKNLTSNTTATQKEEKPTTVAVAARKVEETSPGPDLKTTSSIISATIFFGRAQTQPDTSTKAHTTALLNISSTGVTVTGNHTTAQSSHPSNNLTSFTSKLSNQTTTDGSTISNTLLPTPTTSNVNITSTSHSANSASASNSSTDKFDLPKLAKEHATIANQSIILSNISVVNISSLPGIREGNSEDLLKYFRNFLKQGKIPDGDTEKFLDILKNVPGSASGSVFIDVDGASFTQLLTLPGQRTSTAQTRQTRGTESTHPTAPTPELLFNASSQLSTKLPGLPGHSQGPDLANSSESRTTVIRLPGESAEPITLIIPTPKLRSILSEFIKTARKPVKPVRVKADVPFLLRFLNK